MNGFDDEITPRTARRHPAAKVMVWIMVVLIVLSMIALMIP